MTDTFAPGPRPNTVRATDGRILTVPDGWVLLPPGDAALTRRVKGAADHWIVQERKGRKVFSRGVWAPAVTIGRIRAELEAERSTESYALAGESGISDQDFLERMARSDELVDHDGETCGQCYYTILGAEVAREMIEAGEYEDVVSKWAAEHKRRWEKSKFFKLWEKEKQAGRDPRKAFKDRGWDP